MSKNLKNKIIELRSSGLTYDEIVSKLGCSKGTVSYYCGNNQKEKCLNRQQKSRLEDSLKQKRHNFLGNSHKTNSIIPKENLKLNFILSNKISQFRRKIGKNMFTLDELKNKIGPNPKCYLTGRDIDLSKPKTYHLDHIIPVSRGGDNSLDNCNIACKEANMAKSDLLVSEFYQLCQDVVNKLSN